MEFQRTRMLSALATYLVSRRFGNPLPGQYVYIYLYTNQESDPQRQVPSVHCLPQYNAYTCDSESARVVLCLSKHTYIHVISAPAHLKQANASAGAPDPPRLNNKLQSNYQYPRTLAQALQPHSGSAAGSCSALGICHLVTLGSQPSIYQDLVTIHESETKATCLKR